ncbi:MAG: large subunit ribosomal protein, partial [Acidobacteriaceae bacterium]|nr:large subunit ribosomal protein [Acidobacteriaceae bacterium]
MPRVKRGTKRNDRRKKILKRASGYFLTKSKVAAGGANTCEDETLAADRHGAQHRYREADVGGRLQIFDDRISPILILGIHDPAVIDARIVVGHDFGQGIPVPGRKMRPFV